MAQMFVILPKMFNPLIFIKQTGHCLKCNMVIQPSFVHLSKVSPRTDCFAYGMHKIYAAFVLRIAVFCGCCTKDLH